MFQYDSNVTFLNYNDLSIGIYICEDVLNLQIVLDQGFARIYQVNKTGYIGIVKRSKESLNNGDTLVSMNTKDVHAEHKRISEFNVADLTSIQRIDSVPLDTFFFKDSEGHHFEIQQFLSAEAIAQFLSKN